jgi:polyhydroxyalkanoate synthase
MMELGIGGAPALRPEDVPEFSLNLARATFVGQQAVLENLGHLEVGAAEALDRIALPLSLIHAMRPASPETFWSAQHDFMEGASRYWRETLNAAWAGGQAAAPHDKRFRGEAWSNPLFDAVRRTYLANATLLNNLARCADADDPLAKRRLQFFTRLLTDLFSPSNFLGSNPEALAEAVRTKGESLVRGMENFAADLKRGGGELAVSQTDMAKFKVGENLATTPGKVVFQNDLLQLIQYQAATAQVREVPLLIAPAFINKYYILDLQPANSMVRWLTEQGFTVFVTSWVNPDARHREKTFEHYMAEGLLTAIDKVMDQCRVKHVNVVGYCVAGTLLACTLAYLAAKNVDSPINSATFFAAQQDFSDAGDLALFVDQASLDQIERRMDKAGGVLPGSAMGEAFNLLRANDLIFSFVVNNYLMGKRPKAFDLLFWNADQTRLPKSLGLWYLRSFYQENLFARGELELGGVRLDLSKVTTPVFVQSAREDHIAPPESVYRGARLFGGPATFLLAGSGHIAGVVNHPAANKYQHWTNAALPASLEDWKEDAAEHPGSWWPTWAAWLHERSGSMVAARDPAAGAFHSIEDAPGSYVRVMC